MKSLILVCATIIIHSPLFAQAFDPAECLKKADAVRNPSDSYEMQIEVETSKNKSLFDVYLKGGDKTLIVTKEPSRDKGRNMLMLDRDFHSYVPNLKRSMKLSLSQKLSGQVANGDISRTRWYGDYTPTLEKTEGMSHQLFLKAAKENLTYANIRLWLDSKTCEPQRAEYLSLDGKKVLKKASFADFKQLAGAKRPSTIQIEDLGQDINYIRIKSMNVKSFNDSFFTIPNMERMK